MCRRVGAPRSGGRGGAQGIPAGGLVAASVHVPVARIRPRPACPATIDGVTVERRANRLAAETSPYLLQHAHNPVDWYPWGPEALARARTQDRPIFLSIGYAACHWCHVMERESFEDPATAAQLNANFVAIKVDREERPDLDQVYMAAVQAMTGQGGWPMSVFLTPEGKPFHGGTYFPNEPRHGLPSFREILGAVAATWRDRRSEVESAGTRLVDALTRETDHRTGAMPAPTALDAAVATLETNFDAAHGGWGRAPKFPQSMTIEFLLRRWVGAGDARALAMGRRTLDRMADGGIHDQLGGGFHRYATDATWLVPHFEKMLYDNAQLARVYLHTWQATGERGYLDIALDTLGYMLRDLRRDDGTFAASHDADTNGVEGETFIWMHAEVESHLGPELAPLFVTAHGVTPAGNWEGRTILSRVASDAQLASIFETSEENVRAGLARARSILLERRSERPQPARDDKALAAWNGLAIGAFADAARVLEWNAAPGLRAFARTCRDAARQAAETILTGLCTPDGRLARSWKDGRASQRGVLEDYAHLSAGLLALYQATFEERWFVAARDLAEQILAHFADPAGGFFDTSDEHETLVTRPGDPQDNALPSGSAMAATVLLDLAALTGEGRYRDAAERAIGQVGPFVDRYPLAFGQWLVAVDQARAPVIELAIVGDAAESGTKELLAPASVGYRPHQVIAVSGDPDASAVELLHGRTAIDGRPTAYVCRAFACRRPTTDPAELAAQIAGTAG